MTKHTTAEPPESASPTRATQRNAAPLLGAGDPAITQDEIATRAYDRYVTRGREDGHDLDDWLNAERQLRDQGKQ